MSKIKNDPELVSFCGLYCGACKKFRKGKCPGCAKNEEATWCTVRKCCLGSGFTSCAECQKFFNIMECKNFNNFFSKLFGFIFRSDRKAGIERIQEIGLEGFASEMAKKGTHSIKRQR